MIEHIQSPIAIYPSLLACDWAEIYSFAELLGPYCDGFHIDIMDGLFVTNTFQGDVIANTIADRMNKTLHVHLMVKNPVAWIDKLFLRAEDVFIFHYEACSNLNVIKDVIARVKEKVWKVGIAINPMTSIALILPLLAELDLVLLMGVNPGASGQKFIPSVIKKISELVAFRKGKRMLFNVCLDGGVNDKNLVVLWRTGVNNFAIGSAIFDSEDPVIALQKLYLLAKNRF